MVAQPTAPSRPPASIEDFLWSLTQTLSSNIAGFPSPLPVDSLKEAYAKHHGHKCAIERWLVVGDGGLAATFKRIPHIVSLFEANGTTFVKSALGAAPTKEALVEADLAFRRQLQAKNAAAKLAKAGSKAPPPAAPENGAKAGGPTRPPATIEDFLWNLHQVLDTADNGVPIDELKDAYSKQLGHKCAIERFLVVGDIGLAGTLKRIPHVATVTTVAGKLVVTPSLPKGSKREDMVQADLDYRKSLQQKNAASKAATAGGKAAPPAAAAKSAAPAPSDEPDAKRQKPAGDAETLSRMLVQGVVRVLQHRAKEGKGALPVNDLAEEFKALWKVPFNLASAGYTDVVAFLKAWPNKVEVTSDAGGVSVALAKKGAGEKAPDAKADAPAPAAAAAASPTSEAADGEPDAKKAKTTDQDTLSRMLVQGVVRVLQSRAKDGKGDLLVSNLAEEFKTLWKVPFNLASAGYTDVNAFLKAWPNKVEFSTFANGDVVGLAKKANEKASAPAAASAIPAAAKSSAPVPPQAAAVAPVVSADLDAPLPSSAAEIQKELARNVQDLDTVSKRQQALVVRQKALIAALSR